jgi:hypothetical protein
MKFSQHKILSLLLFYLFCGSLSGNEISSYSLFYLASANGIKGNAQRKLTRIDENTFELKNNVEVTVAGQLITSLKETSKVELFENSIRPILYSMQQSGITTASHRIAYDWSDMLITSNDRQQLSRRKLRSNIYDQLSHQLLLQQQIIEGNTELTFTIINRGDLETYAYKILGEEQIVTPLGTFESIKIARLHDENSRRETIFWLALNIDGILLRAEQTTKFGLSIFLEIQAGTVNGIPISAPN